MRHRNKKVQLNRPKGHRKALLRHLLTGLFEHGAIITTVPKAKLVKRWADRLITWAKKGDLHHRRLAARYLYGHEALQRLFDEWAEQLQDRNSGYTRTVRYKRRRGDGAPLMLIHIIGAIEEETSQGSTEEEEA